MPHAISGYTKQELIVGALFPIGYASGDYTGDFQTHVNQLFDEGLIEICSANDWRFLHTSAALSVASGASTYDLEANSILVDDIEALFVTTEGKARRVEKDDWKKFLRQDPEATNTGTPCRYDRWGETALVFDRALDADLAMKLLYKQIPPLVTLTSAYPIVPRRYQRNLRNYLKWKLASDKGDRRAATFAEEYIQALQSDIIKDQGMLDSGRDVIEQPGDISGPGYQPTYQDYLNRNLG